MSALRDETDAARRRLAPRRTSSWCRRRERRCSFARGPWCTAVCPASAALRGVGGGGVAAHGLPCSTLSPSGGGVLGVDAVASTVVSHPSITGGAVLVELGASSSRCGVWRGGRGRETGERPAGDSLLSRRGHCPHPSLPCVHSHLVSCTLVVRVGGHPTPLLLSLACPLRCQRHWWRTRDGWRVAPSRERETLLSEAACHRSSLVAPPRWLLLLVQALSSGWVVWTSPPRAQT